MTGQIADKVFYDGTEYELIRVQGGPLFRPGDFGLHPTMFGTGCYRGFYCEYHVQASGLVLTRAVIHTKDNVYPSIMGVEAVYEPRRVITEAEAKAILPLEGRFVISRKTGRDSEEREWTLFYVGGIYARLSVPIPFTGGMLLGAEMIRDWFHQMGFPPAESFERLVEVELEAGQIIAMHDHSTRAVAYRELIAQLDSESREFSQQRIAREREFAWHFKFQYPRVAFNYEPVAPP